MPNRYEYDLDGNNEWRWIAIGANGATVGVSPVGYANLQDCMHAVGLMQAPGNFHVLPNAAFDAPPPPERSLSRLQRR